MAACHTGARVLAGESATTQAVTDGLVGAPLVHIVAHGRFRHDNPLWSTIELADGPLSVYELELLEHTPPMMVLASCDSGVGGPLGVAVARPVADSAADGYPLDRRLGQSGPR